MTEIQVCWNCGQQGTKDGPYCEKTWGGAHAWDSRPMAPQRGGDYRDSYATGVVYNTR